MELPSLVIPKTEIVDPSRAKDRRLIALPRDEKLRTLKDEPKRTIP
jgi:hypothetical protein